MDTISIQYDYAGKTYSISKRELYSVLASTEECLSPAFNMQIQLLIQLIEAAGRSLHIQDVTSDIMARLDDQFPGVNLDTLQAAIKSYHAYASNMYYI